jgi:hypothetical protein
MDRGVTNLDKTLESPMLVFITPLKSASVAESWQKVSQLFERCIRSLCSQTSSHFKVVVVCHEEPLVRFSHPNVEYLRVDFPAPRPGVFDDKLVDKAQKLLLGLHYAQKFQPSHVMLVDADDCVNKNLAEFVAQHPNSNGWFVHSGYEYKEGSRFIYLHAKNFYLKCGTSSILKYDAYDLPEISDGSKPLGKEAFKYLISHRNIRTSMAKRNMPVEALPFPGAIYNIFNGENIYYQKNLSNPQNPRKAHNSDNVLVRHAKQLAKVLTSRPLTGAIREEFGLYNIQQS